MAAHGRFRFRDAGELRAKADALGISLPYSKDLSPLFRPLEIAGRTIGNRLAVQPMEGADAGSDGRPGDLTLRRYSRYATGGAGLIWFEAAAVSREGRSNPRQLVLSRETLDAWKRLVETTRAAASVSGGGAPLLVLQLTHAGRFAFPRPILPRRHPALEAVLKTPADLAIVSDEELLRIRDEFVEAAILAREAGFDGVDVKACHGYLVSELLAARNREDSRFGGPFENRARFLLETAGWIESAVPEVLIAVRLGVYDGVPAPYGFGTGPGEPVVENLEEPLEIAGLLSEIPVGLIGVSAGIPRLAPHVGRPFDRPARGGTVPWEHPLEGIARLIRLAGAVRRRAPRTAVVGTGFSWLRHLFPAVASGAVEKGAVSVAGLGRLSFAYPAFARDLRERGELSPRKCCVACSGCSELLRAGIPAGCVVRDRSVYKRWIPSSPPSPAP